jgi:hypothetical protein
VRGRIHVETDDVFYLGGEGRIVGFLEGSDAVRLEAMGAPDALNGAQTDTYGIGHHAARPVGRGFRRFAAGQRQHAGNDRRRQRRLARLAGLVAQQSRHAFFGEALLPTPHRRPARAAAGRHIQYGQPLRRQKNNHGPLDMLLSLVAILHDGGQTLAVRGVDDGADGLCHPHRIAQPSPIFKSYVWFKTLG